MLLWSFWAAKQQKLQDRGSDQIDQASQYWDQQSRPRRALEFAHGYFVRLQQEYRGQAVSGRGGVPGFFQKAGL